MLASVDGAFTELEANDTVIASNGFVGEFVEHTGSDPLVTPLAKRGVRHAVAQETFNVHPCAAGDEADQDALETDPVRDTATMAAERVLIHGPARKQRLHCCPNGIYHLGIEHAHDDGPVLMPGATL